MSGFLYRGRHCTGNREAIPKSTTHMDDFSSDETEKGPPLQTHSLREFEKHLNDLKKENFSLKLRIYFLEERIQGRCEDSSSEDVHRKNIELKVEVESLKQELLERQQQLDKVLTTETQSNQNGANVQHHCEEKQQEISHIQEVLENKIQQLQEESKLARSEAEKMASLAASESQRCAHLEDRIMTMEAKETQEEMLADKERRIQTLTGALVSKEEEVRSLHEERNLLTHKASQLEEEVQVLSKLLQQKENNVKSLEDELEFGKNLKQIEMQKLISEQQVQLVQYENAAGQCVTELQKAQLQVQSLQTKIRESEANNKKLQQRLGVMECELMSFQERAQGQERTIQTISDSLSTKDNEVADLQQLIEEQKQLLISLKMQSQHEQLQRSTTEPSLLQAQLLELQASLFSTQLELQSVQRAQRQAQMREDDLTRANQRLLNDLQALQDHRREAELHNQELLAALQRARSDLEQMEEKWKEGKGDKESEVEERERTIRDLKTRLQHKEQLLHDYTELLDGQKEAGGSRDVLVHKLKLRIQERDRALERAVDERFVCVEQKETEVRKLQLLLREKERDLQKLRCVLSNNEETITSLEVLLRGKSIELEQVNEAWRGSQRVQRECEDRHNCSMRERDTLISQLQTALHTRTKDAEELTAALLSKLPLSSGEVVEKLKAQLQIKERLFQELLAEHGRQTQEHHTHIQELLNAAHTREQCIKDSAERAGKVMSEQTARLQELRMQVRSAGSRSPSAAESFEDAQLLQDELRLVLSKDKEAQRELSVLRSALANTQEQLLTQTSQLNSLNHTSKPEHLVPMETEHAASSHTDTGDSTSDVEEEEGGISDFTESTEEEEHGRVSAQALFNKQGYEQHGGPVLSQTPAEVEGQGLAEVKLLVEQKKAVERKLWELKAQLENAGFTSFSQMRRALLSLRMENEELRNTVRRPEPEEETHTLLEEQRARGVQWQSEPCEGKKRCSRVLCLDAGTQLSHSTQPVQKPVPKLQEKFIVSKPTIQTQEERLRDSKEQRMETPVQHNSKQVQVDLQDLGYETCGRSENEAEREDTSSPEFDDLELCTSLSCRDGTPQWWSGLSATDRAGGDVASLQQQVEDLQVQLSRSQALVLRLQSRHQDSTPNSTPGKSNREDRELQELVTRVSSLEEQLRKGKGHTAEEPKSSTRTGNFDTLIQAQARELSHLRQRLREGRSVCHILTQHLGDTTKSFEELLRDNDIDYYMGQSFRDQLAQSSALAQRVAAKISSRDYSEIPDDKTGHELLAIRLSKELQQKDKLIESLHSKLELQQQRADTPTSSRSLSGEADQLDRGSFVIDEQGSTNEDLDLCSELDTVSEFGQDEVADDPLQPAQSHPHPSNPPSVTSSHGHQSSSCCPSMHCAPLIQTELSSAPLPQKPQCLSAQMAFLPFDPQTQHLRPRSNTTGGFSLAEVHQELQRLQRELANSFSSAQVKPLPGVFHQTDHNDFHLPPQHVFQQSPFASLHASPGMTYGVQLKRESTYNDISSSSSGYQSGARHTGTDLMEEHLREIRSLHRRLEESIQTNERLRQQLAERLDSSKQDGGAPTNIYIQGLDSLNQLSNEVQFLKEENQALQSQLQQASRDVSVLDIQEGMKQVEQLRDAVLVEHTRLEQAELEAERWAGQFRQLQAQMREQTQVALQLKQDKQISQENANRLQHEVNILQQQLSESRRLVLTLQRELETYRRTCETTHTDSQEPEMREAACRMHMLEQQLSDRLDPEVLHISARKHLFHDSSSSPPVRGTGALNPASALSAQLQFSVARSGLNKSEAPDGLFACRTGCHVVGHWDDFSSLQQQLLEGKVFICKMETALQSTMEINLHEDCVRNLLTSTKTLKQILEDIGSVLRMFWRAALPSTETTSPHEKEKPLPDEVVALRHKLAEQEQTLRETMESLKNSNRTKDSMEQFIVSQLTRTRDVLKKAHTNLQKNELRINSLGCSFLPPSPQSFSFTPPWASRGEVSNTGCSSSSGPSIMTPGHDPHKPVQRVVKHFGMQRPLQMFSGSERTTLHIHAAAPTPC